MWKKILLISGCIINFWNVNAMIESEQMIDNPIPKIVQKYKEISPQKVMEDFEKSTDSLIKEVKSFEKIYSVNDYLRQKWEKGLELLRRVNDFLKSLEIKEIPEADFISSFSKELEKNNQQAKELYNDVTDFTNNGFYTVSQVFFTDSPEQKEILSQIFEKFWLHLLQAKEIVIWNVGLLNKLSSGELLEICQQMRKIIERQSPLNVLLFDIGLLVDTDSVMAEIDPDGEYSTDVISTFKQKALQDTQTFLTEEQIQNWGH